MDIPNTPPIQLPDPPLSDGVVTLRPWRQSDVPAIMTICSDELSARFTTVPSPYAEADAREWLSTHAVDMARGTSVSLALTALPSDEAVGSIGIRVHAPGMAEIGYITAPAARGRGLMPRAVTLLSDWAFGALDLERLQLGTFPGNPASQRVAEKCGFTYEGVLRRYGVQRGSRVDLSMFARIRE